MEYMGVGTITGLYGVSGISKAVLVDSSQAFDNIRKGIERITSERSGKTGFRSIAGRQADTDVIVVQIPPYPQAVVEAVSELYAFGVRQVVAISGGHRLSRKMPSRAALVVRGAVPMDDVSRAIAGQLPLLPSYRIESVFREMIESRFSDFNWVYGVTVTVASPHLRHYIEKIRGLTGRRWIAAADSVSAPLYAMQYELPGLEAISLLVMTGATEPFAESTIVRSMDEFEADLERVAREETILYMVAIEVLKKLE
ncbi:MAG: hypothetical protein F7C35_02975 [Desulfurococcales archaeon]|nr:hypothetical protein [Desulfurococcales archaeon]